MPTTTPKWKYDAPIAFTKTTRLVNTIFLHCSASDVNSHDDISVMKKWHVEDNGWSDVGYHFFINKNGNIQEGRSTERTPSAQKSHNTGSIAICCHGLKKDNFTDKQMTSLKALCKAITHVYTENVRIRGHREVSSKSCPVYDYREALGLDEKGYFTPTAATEKSPSPKQESGEIDTETLGLGSKIKTIKILDSSDNILALQSVLCELGFQCSKDGIFGQQTKTTIVSFQKTYKLKPDGIVGGKTIDKMFSSKDVTLKIKDKGVDVLILQLLLSMHGQNLIHDGLFGHDLKAALTSVQRLLQLKSDGIFGKISRRAMT